MAVSVHDATRTSGRIEHHVHGRNSGRIAAGHAFVQNLRRGHYELATEVPQRLRLAASFTELALAI